MRITPGIAVGGIRFGLKPEEVIRLLGNPIDVELSEYCEGSGDWHKILFYDVWNFTFNREDDYRLSCITITAPGASLFGEKIFAKPLNLIKNHYKAKTGIEPRYEDHSCPSFIHESLNCDKWAITFWFDDGICSELQCSVQFAADGETILWPSQMPKRLSRSQTRPRSGS